MIESSPISVLPGVGPKVAQLFKKIGITTVGELLRHFPSGYDDYTHQLKVSSLEAGQQGWLEGKVVEVKSRRSFGRRGLYITEAKFTDDTGLMNLVWFNRFPIKNLPNDKLVRIAGKVDSDGLSMRNPMWEMADKESRFAHQMLGRYPSTVGLSQSVIRNAIQPALKTVVKEWLPEVVLNKYELPSIHDSIQLIHKPDRSSRLQAARSRLAFDEVFLLQLAEKMQLYKRHQIKTFSISSEQLFVDKFVGTLPFKMTEEQMLVVDEVLLDLAREYPMNRLLQGEVGSGKTIVATAIMAVVLNAGYKSLYLAPTEVLANQQFESISQFYNPYKYKIALLSRGSQKTNYGIDGRASVIKEINQGEVDLVIGTHAILNVKITQSQLALVVVDEQHRFGVEQRLAALKQGDVVPHVLAMTATPIPRTLQQAYYADLDISSLKKVPTGKRNVTTYVAKPAQRNAIEKRLRDHLDAGEQAYVVCPLIDPSDKLAARAAVSEYERLRDGPLSKYKVGYLHGRMKAEEKQATLVAFRDKRLDVLVATSVVEVGLDIPNATTIIIEGAERFGLAQLHQLRGRVGRKGQAGYCLLFTENPSEKAWDRLNKFADTKDGFALAELDLSLRGPGEWFGVKQSGYPDFKMATLSDTQILNAAKEAASDLLEDDPMLSKYPDLSQRVEKLVRVASMG